MKIYVIGVERVSYTSKKTGQPVDGLSVFFANISKKSAGLDGYRTDKLWIPRGDSFYDFNFEIGAAYLVYMDGYSLEEVHPIDLPEDSFSVSFR